MLWQQLDLRNVQRRICYENCRRWFRRDAEDIYWIYCAVSEHEWSKWRNVVSFLLFKYTLSKAWFIRCRACSWILILNWEGYWRKWLWCTLRYYPKTSLEMPPKTTATAVSRTGFRALNRNQDLPNAKQEYQPLGLLFGWYSYSRSFREN
jgi:hypothetical protein